MRLGNDSWVLVLVLGCLGCWAAQESQVQAGEPGNTGLVILESPGLERWQFERWLDFTLQKATAEAARREEERRQKTWSLDRLAELERKGFAAKMEVAQARRERRAADRESEAARAYQGLLQWLWDSAAEAVFQKAEDRPAPVHLRLPGITQRVGEADYFTLTVTGNPALLEAVKEVEAGVLRMGGAGAFGLPGSFLVRGSAVAAPLMPETVALARPVLHFRAGARGEIRLRQAQWDDARRRLALVEKAVGKGVANEVERQRLQMAADLAEGAWKEAEARSRLAQWEWARFQNLTGSMDREGSWRKCQAVPWKEVAEAAADLQHLLGRASCSTGEIKAMLRLGREVLRTVVAVKAKRDRQVIASDLVTSLRRMDGSRQAERDRAKVDLEVAEADLLWAEEQLQECRLAFEHQAGLCKFRLQPEAETWSLRNAAVWGKKLAGVEAEIALHRREQAEVRLVHEQRRLEALRPLLERGASSSFEVHQQELTCRLAEGAHCAVRGSASRIGVKTEFLEAIGSADSEKTAQPGGISGRAWTLLAAYASAMAAPCPGKLTELEAARDLVNLRRDELSRLREAGLARVGEVRETKRLSSVLLEVARVEMAKNDVSEAMQQLVGAASLAHAGFSTEAPPRDSGRVIEAAPLP